MPKGGVISLLSFSLSKEVDLLFIHTKTQSQIEKRNLFVLFFAYFYHLLKKILNQKGFDAWNQCYFT